jgi:hypothetical protein
VLLKPLLVLLALVLLVLVLLQALALGLDLALGALLGQSGELARGRGNTPPNRKSNTQIPYSHSPLSPLPCIPIPQLSPYSLSRFPCDCHVPHVLLAVPVIVASPVVKL